jgi:putative methyltransferase (TIGR04325 family)
MDLLKKIAKKLFFPTKKTKTYTSYQEAMQDATQSGYEDKALVEVVFTKTKWYLQKLQQSTHGEIDFKTANLLFAILNVQKAQVHVLGLGSACGAHYFEVRKLLPPNIRLNWVVVETPAMVAKAKALSNEELSFSDDLAKASQQIGKIDLFHTSGTLQCVDAPFLYLQQIIETGASYLLFNRMNFTLKSEPITIIHESFLWEHGIGTLADNNAYHTIVKYPYSYLPKQRFDELISASMYKLWIEFNDDSGASPINNEPIIGKGLLFRRIE